MERRRNRTGLAFHPGRHSPPQRSIRNTLLCMQVAAAKLAQFHRQGGAAVRSTKSLLSADVCQSCSPLPATAARCSPLKRIIGVGCDQSLQRVVLRPRRGGIDLLPKHSAYPFGIGLSQDLKVLSDFA